MSERTLDETNCIICGGAPAGEATRRRVPVDPSAEPPRADDICLPCIDEFFGDLFGDLLGSR